MSNLKTKILVFFVMLLVVMAFSSVFADDSYLINLSVSYNGKDLRNNEQIELFNTDTNRTLTITTDAKYVDDSLTIYVMRSGREREILATGKKSATFEIPSDLREGYLTSFAFEAVVNNFAAEPDYVGNSNGFQVKVHAPVPEDVTVTANLEYRGATIAHLDTIRAYEGEELVVSGNSNIGVKVVAYKWDNGEVVEVNGSKTTIKVPALGDGKKLSIVAQATDDKWSNSKTFTILPEAKEDETTIEAYLKVNGGVVENRSTIKVTDGIKVEVEGVSNKSVKVVSYKWSNGDVVELNTKNAEIKLPANVDGLELSITAQAEDGKWANVKKFTFVKDSAPADQTTIVAKLLVNGYEAKEGLSIKATDKTKVEVVGVSNKTVKVVSYKWANKDVVEVKGSSAVIPMTTNFQKVQLSITAQAEDGKWADVKTYTFIKDEDDDPEDPEHDDDDELIVEPWMKENKELNKLAVSLRSEPYDDEEDRANKNIYALDEKVVYYVDYKNGGKKITTPVKLTLNIPLSYTVVDRDGGSVDKKAGTITWNFRDGLDKEECGTKTVIVKFTSLGNSKSITYKRITPKATIYQDGKKKDVSGVINLIVKDFDEEIRDEHDPYMFGDRNASTFRPDDTITRAEGALVLTRIFGISTSYDSSKYDFPDLDETYLEARRAIRAAKAYGLIEGYPDGNYYPNKTMTRGEFMTIIARQIEEDEEEGFEVKDENELIKIYKDKNRIYYISDTENYDAHWSAEYATLLCRLNMTPVTNKETNLRLDNEITRAEVAQLVNFYLLRAPAATTKGTTTKFTDVSRSHKLFADIVEATRPSHNWSLTEDGKEQKED